MDRLEHIRLLLRGITYKPWANIHFTVTKGADSSFIRVFISIQSLDKSTPDHLVTVLGRQIVIWQELSDDHIIEAVFHAVSEIEQHEVKEWLEFRGKPIHDPHPELKASRENARN